MESIYIKYTPVLDGLRLYYARGGGQIMVFNVSNAKQKNVRAAIQLVCTNTRYWPASVLIDQWQCQTCFTIF